MFKRYFPATLMVLVALGLGGCSSTTEHNKQAKVTSVPMPVKASVEKEVKPDIDEMALLLEHYQRWQGVPYSLGGTSQQGVDCSGYIQNLFKDSFAQALPRTTTQQSQQGKPVKRNELRTGDLVFFKVSQRTQHVGVYLDNGKFLHASTSKGVIISQLDNPYWRNRYWTSRRI